MIAKIVLLFAGTILAFWISAICGGASLILILVLNLLISTSLFPFSLTVKSELLSDDHFFFPDCQSTVAFTSKNKTK